MLSSYKFKIIMGGVSDPEIVPFFNNSEFNGEDFSQIGISINPIECMTNLGDSYLFILWHLNQQERFEFMISSFCHGSRGGIICVDKSKSESYIEAEKWIKMLNNEIENISLVILSFQSDPFHKEVSNENVSRLVDQYTINGHYIIDPNEEINYLLKKDFFKFLIKIFNDKNLTHSNFSIMFPTEEKDFIKFSKNYHVCPVCKKKNHMENLKEFYFSKNEEVMLLREKFFELKEKYNHLGNCWSNSLNLGILCCSCYKKYFSESNFK